MMRVLWNKKYFITLHATIFLILFERLHGNIYTHEIRCPEKFNQFQCLDDERCQKLYNNKSIKCYILFNCLSLCYDSIKMAEIDVHKRVKKILSKNW